MVQYYCVDISSRHHVTMVREEETCIHDTITAVDRAGDAPPVEAKMEPGSPVAAAAGAPERVAASAGATDREAASVRPARPPGSWR
jgi:hypothetical protein